MESIRFSRENFILMCFILTRFPPNKYVDWVKECITNPRFPISLNGENGRQSDPLSPCLFVTYMGPGSLKVTKIIKTLPKERVKIVKGKEKCWFLFLWSFWMNHIYCLLFPLSSSTRSFITECRSTESVPCNFEIEIIYVYI